LTFHVTLLQRTEQYTLNLTWSTKGWIKPQP